MSSDELSPVGGEDQGAGPPPATGDAGLDLDLLAASLHTDAGDVRVLLSALATKLADVLGGRLQVERQGGGLLRKRPAGPVTRVRVDLGDDLLEAAVDGGRVECTVAHSSGGIRIRSASVGIDEWLRTLLAVLRQEATRSQTTRQALESLLIGDG